MTQHTIESICRAKRGYALVNGDCLDLMRKLPDESVALVLTDPPYGIAYQGKSNRQKAIANDKAPFIWWLYDAARVMADPGALFCFCAWRTQEPFRAAIETAGLKIASQVIWDKIANGMGHTGSTFSPNHEVMWFATKGRFRFPAGRPKSVHRQMRPPSQKRHHSTEKPVALLTPIIERLTKPGDIVLDPCMGSGSTGVAAISCGRRFIGFEIDRDNFDIATNRLRSQDATRACLARPVHCFPVTAA